MEEGKPMANIPNAQLKEETATLSWRDCVDYIRMRTGMPVVNARKLADQFKKEREDEAKAGERRDS